MAMQSPPSPSPGSQAPSPPSPASQAPSPPLAQLMKSLSRPAFRKAFAVDPLRALERVRLDVDQLGAAQLDVLAGLSPADLEVVASVVAQLRKATDGKTVSL